jgi:hypothetical protein
MDEVVSIEPVIGEPGLIAYECPNCVYVTSVLVQPNSDQVVIPSLWCASRPTRL